MARKKYLYRVTVTDPGDDEPRPVQPPAVEYEEETGAAVEAHFWPPSVGQTRHYQSLTAATHRRDWWAMNGVTAEVTRSNPITWPEP
jgi:hypothetical protein